MGLREKELNIEIPKVQNIVIKVHKEQELGLPTYFWVQDTGYLRFHCIVSWREFGQYIYI